MISIKVHHSRLGVVVVIFIISFHYVCVISILKVEFSIVYLFYYVFVVSILKVDF